ncbi:MAG: hypothetical protein PF517_07000 [Salinivirgaceae bacterium]|jgi:predicted peptidase|nr:hypothetical protein [Salinivirgaceae bacterium]
MRNKSIILVSTIALSALLFSCNNSSTEIKDKLGNSIDKSVVVANQKGSVDSSINYCFYLPDSYDGKSILPVIYFLDPHANGKLPASKYAEIVNKYNYILIASNTIKNGMSSQQASKIFTNLISETKNRFQIDEKRMFVAGFSGGQK